jgi:hypothetical protein
MVQGQIANFTAFTLRISDKKGDSYADPNVKDIASLSLGFTATGSRIAFEIDQPNFLELSCDGFTETVKSIFINERAISDESNYSFIANPVARPAEKTNKRIIQFGFPRSAFR